MGSPLLTHSRHTDMKDVDRKDGRRENGRGREALLCFVCHAMEVGGVALLASKNTSCTKHGFESTINARRARPQDLEIQQQTVLIFIGSVAQLPQTTLSLSGNHLHANMSSPTRSLSKNMSLIIMLNKRSKKVALFLLNGRIFMSLPQ